MDVEQASTAIDALIERRAAQRNGADPVEEAWKASEIRHKAKLREQNRQDWQLFYAALAASLRDSAQRYERMARDLSRQVGG